MVRKIGKLVLRLLPAAVFLAVVGYTRMVNIGWGLPYPFHPDERNMAVAVSSLGCSGSFIDAFRLLPLRLFISTCFDPRFYAYGQLPLYVTWLIAQGSQFISATGGGVGVAQATLILRIISALCSIATAVILVRTISLYIRKETAPSVRYTSYGFAIFMPAFIQFAHFGTTESALMCVFAYLTYYSVLRAMGTVSFVRYSVVAGIIFGLAVGVKVSAVSFGALVFFTLVFLSPEKYEGWRSYIGRFRYHLLFGGLAGVFAFLASPFNILNFSSFMGAMNYELDVASGAYRAFYTRQFELAVPFFFQIRYVFPYAVGLGSSVLALFGFILLPKNKHVSVLRIAFILSAAPPMFLYAKWTRFLAPAFPVVAVFAALFWVQLAEYAWSPKRPVAARVSVGVLVAIALYSFIPGIAYVSVYTSPDVRHTASDWIYSHIPDGSYVLSETANVVDIPIPNPANRRDRYPVYRVISFNSYDLDLNPELPSELAQHLSGAEYVLVPSRRVFANHTCKWPSGTMQTSRFGYEPKFCTYVENTYSNLNSYYQDLFTGKLGFVPVAEFRSYPALRLFGKTLFEFPDEQAEETWTVFDHPVVRVYGRANSF